jgi:hypothetical protein
VEIPSDECIRDIPKGVYYHAQGLRLEPFEDFNVGGGSRAPKFFAVDPDGFENCFIEEKFIGSGKF